MASVIIVENDLKDSVWEYGQIIDGVRQNTELSRSLAPFLPDGQGSISNPAELAQLLITASSKEILSVLSDKEFEPAFYLLVYLLQQLQKLSMEDLTRHDSTVLQLLRSCVPAEQPSLRDRRALKPTTILSVLNTLFNLLPASSPNRILLLKDILSVVAETKTSFALIQSAIGSNLAAWMAAAGASDAEIRRTFWFFISLDPACSVESLRLIKAFTAQHELSLDELRALITTALSSSVVDVSFLVNNNVARAAAQYAADELVQTFMHYTHSTLITAVPLALPESVKHKSKILALARFFSDNGSANNNTFSYSAIPHELAASAGELETLLVDSIKAGVIEGKLNQVDETFFCTRTNRAVLAGDDNKLVQDREAVKATLLEWKRALENINEVVLNAKENIVNINSQS